MPRQLSLDFHAAAKCIAAAHYEPADSPAATTLILLCCCRNYSADYDINTRSKQHLNVGTIGHVDHGKTTLTAAITKVNPQATTIGTAATFTDAN